VAPDELDVDGRDPSDNDAGAVEMPDRRHLPWPMVTAAAGLVLVGVGITVVSGPLYGFAERSAADLVGGVSYTRAVLPEGIR
jgi:multicomponent Na+:H+ antiporter subunit D